MFQKWWRWLTQERQPQEVSKPEKPQASPQEQTRQEMKQRQANTRQDLNHLRKLGRHAPNGEPPKLNNPEVRKHLLDALKFIQRFDKRKTSICPRVREPESAQSGERRAAVIQTWKRRKRGFGQQDVRNHLGDVLPRRPRSSEKDGGPRTQSLEYPAAIIAAGFLTRPYQP